MNDVRPLHRAALAVACLLSIAVAACTQSPAPKTSAPSVEMHPETVNGVQIVAVTDGSSAIAKALKPGDIVVAVGERDVRDLATFDAILAERGASSAPLELVIVRDRRLTSAVASGDFAVVQRRTWVGVLELLLDFVARRDMDAAKTALDAGIADNRLTPAQAIVGRLALVPKGTAKADVAARTDLIRQLETASKPTDLKLYATDYFLNRGLHDTAAELFAVYLQRQPEDFSARLNLAAAQTYLGQYAEAERETTRAEKDGAGQIAPQGLQLIDHTRAWSALARKDYKAAEARLASMVDRQPPTTDYSSYLRYLYALARTGETTKFAAGLERLKEASAKLTGLTYQAKLLEAFALAEQGKRDEAVAVAAGGEPVLPQPVIDIWKATPGGDDVLSTWNVLKASPK